MAPVVLVTGCSSGGIGYALCEEFAREGCKVYATSRNVGTIGTFEGGDVERLSLDVKSDESVDKVFQQIVEKEGKIDIVVNNAGVIAPGALIDQTLEYVKDVFDTNTFSILRICRTAMPIMAKRHSGVIVNIGSIVGEIATPWNGIYCASKAAAQSISDVLSMEGRPLGISVLHIAPGSVTSNISANAERVFKLPPDSLYARFLPNILQRLHASQGPHSMGGNEFARKVVVLALCKNPPAYRYALLGGNIWLFTLLRMLPKTLVLHIMWRKFTKKS